jgi:hypothetical protein
MGIIEEVYSASFDEHRSLMKQLLRTQGGKREVRHAFRAAILSHSTRNMDACKGG